MQLIFLERKQYHIEQKKFWEKFEIFWVIKTVIDLLSSVLFPSKNFFELKQSSFNRIWSLFCTMRYIV